MSEKGIPTATPEEAKGEEIEITEVPETGIEAIPEAEEIVKEPETTKPATSADKRKSWKENYNVAEVLDVDTVDRLTVKVGVNTYKGNTLVFMAKVTDKDFSKQFYSMPAWMWVKAIEKLKEIIPRVAEIEKKAMAENAKKELMRLKELGIDIDSLVKGLK